MVQVGAARVLSYPIKLLLISTILAIVLAQDYEWNYRISLKRPKST